MHTSLRSPKTLSRWLRPDYAKRPRALRRLWGPVLLGTLGASVVAVGVDPSGACPDRPIDRGTGSACPGPRVIIASGILPGIRALRPRERCVWEECCWSMTIR
jgi:hypothetical protein